MRPPSADPKLARLLAQAHAAHVAGALAQAERGYRTVLDRDPHHAAALHLMGFLQHQRGRAAPALRYLDAALKQNPRAPDVRATHALVLHGLGRFDEALASYDIALAGSDDDDLRNKRGIALMDSGRLDAALAAFDDVLARQPHHAEARGNRGNALIRLNRPEEAIVCYDVIRAVEGDSARLLTNRAHALRRLDRLDEALTDLRRALALDAGYAEATFELGLTLLARGEAAAGWAAYEQRWQTGAFAAHRRDFTSPRWTGEQPLQGRTILLHAEQGFGDTIQFVRYAPLVAARGAAVILEVQGELRRLMTSLAGVTQVIVRGEKLPPFDLHCPLMSLPFAFGTDDESVPHDTPYLAPPPDALVRWQGVLPQGRPRIGLCWAGQATHRNDANRSLTLAQLAPLLADPAFAFVSLQVGASDGDRALMTAQGVADLSQRLGDFADTAALMTQLDLIVSVDTAVAHLAGALARPAIVLLPFAADFRWLRERGDTPWYPGMTLLRQPAFRDWDTPLAQLYAELKRRFPA